MSWIVFARVRIKEKCFRLRKRKDFNRFRWAIFHRKHFVSNISFSCNVGVVYLLTCIKVLNGYQLKVYKEIIGNNGPTKNFTICLIGNNGERFWTQFDWTNLKLCADNFVLNKDFYDIQLFHVAPFLSLSMVIINRWWWW